MSERRIRRQIREAEASLVSLDYRIGHLMSLRVTREENLASLYDQLTALGLPIEESK